MHQRQAKTFGRRFDRYPLRQAFIVNVLVALAATGSAAAFEPAWADTRQIGPFVCQSTFPLDDYERTLRELPELQRELVRTLGVPAARGPIHIYLFADADEHRQFIAARFPKTPYRQALFVQTDTELDVFAYRQPELEVDLRHECTHALLHGGLGDLPLWLDEGLAEYFEVRPSQRASGSPNFELLRWNMRLGMVRSVESLENRRELAEMSRLDYAYSWAWVHYMLHGPEPAHRVLVEYLTSARQGSSDTPLSTRINAAVPNSSGRLVQHFTRWRQ